MIHDDHYDDHYDDLCRRGAAPAASARVPPMGSIWLEVEWRILISSGRTTRLVVVLVHCWQV